MSDGRFHLFQADGYHDFLIDRWNAFQRDKALGVVTSELLLKYRKTDVDSCGDFSYQSRSAVVKAKSPWTFVVIRPRPETYAAEQEFVTAQIRHLEAELRHLSDHQFFVASIPIAGDVDLLRFNVNAHKFPFPWPQAYVQGCVLHLPLCDLLDQPKKWKEDLHRFIRDLEAFYRELAPDRDALNAVIEKACGK